MDQQARELQERAKTLQRQAKERQEQAEMLRQQAGEKRQDAATLLARLEKSLDPIKDRADQIKAEASCREVPVKICCLIMSGHDFFSTTTRCTLGNMVDPSKLSTVDDLARDHVTGMARRFRDIFAAAARDRWREAMQREDLYVLDNFGTVPSCPGHTKPLLRVSCFDENDRPRFRGRSFLDVHFVACDRRGHSEYHPLRLVLRNTKTVDGQHRACVDLGVDTTTDPPSLKNLGAWHYERVDPSRFPEERKRDPREIKRFQPRDTVYPSGQSRGLWVRGKKKNKPQPKTRHFRLEDPNVVNSVVRGIQIAAKIVAQGAEIQAAVLCNSAELTDKSLALAMAEAPTDKTPAWRLPTATNDEDAPAPTLPLLSFALDSGESSERLTDQDTLASLVPVLTSPEYRELHSAEANAPLTCHLYAVLRDFGVTQEERERWLERRSQRGGIVAAGQ